MKNIFKILLLLFIATASAQNPIKFDQKLQFTNVPTFNPLTTTKPVTSLRQLYIDVLGNVINLPYGSGGGTSTVPTIAQVLISGNVSNLGQYIQLRPTNNLSFSRLGGDYISVEGNGDIQGVYISKTGIDFRGTQSFASTIKCTNITQSSFLELPNTTGTHSLPISVNNVFADINGNITIAASGGTVTSVSGTTNVITVATGTTTPVIDISSTYTTTRDAYADTKVANDLSSSTTVAPSKSAVNIGLGLKADISGNLSQFSTTTSSELIGVLSDETGTGTAVFSTSPTLSNPIVGTQTVNDNSTKAASTAYVDTTYAPVTGLTFNGTNISLDKIGGRSYLAYTQTGTITFAVSGTPTILGFAVLTITANGSPINPVGAWKNIGNDTIVTTNGTVNRFIFTQVDGEIWYSVKVN
jgi:hypothetical protein